jgi:hypothetical integral membrane protein (TIGR02206 family)
MKPYIHLFGPAHLSILAAVLVLAALLALLHRWMPAHIRAIRLGVAAALLADTAMFYAHQARHHQITFPDHLPLELCDASLVLVIVSLFTLKPLAFDLAYYWTLAGASMAMLTPNLWEPFPSFGTVQFFIAHGLTISAVLYMVWSGQARPRSGSVLRALVGVNLFAAAVGAFDAVFKTDYFYLRAKPANASLLDYLGPWPIYLLSTDAVALALFALLYLPVWWRHRAEDAVDRGARQN